MHADAPSVYTHPSHAHQFELGLADRTTDGLLHERLASAVEAFNAATDPAERVEIHAEMTRLRAILHPPRRATVAAKGVHHG